jgi:hypothetical protein
MVALATEVAPRRSRKWSVDQVNMLLALRAQGVEWPEIRAAINALPGIWVVSPQMAQHKYSVLKRIGLVAVATVKNSQVACPADTGRVAAGTFPAARPGFLDVSSLNSPPVPKEPEALFGAGGAMRVTYEQARRWAIRNGLCEKCNGLDLIAVNEARIAAGQAKFAIKGAL